MDTSTEPNKLEELTKTQLDVLCGLLSGMTDDDIAKFLDAGKNTVAKHISMTAKILGLQEDKGSAKRPRHREKLKEQINLEDVDAILREKFKSDGLLPLSHHKVLPPLTKTIPLDDPRYIVREADEDCLKTLREGSQRQDSRPLIRLRSQWGMGKSSLLTRLGRDLTAQGYIVGLVDLGDTAIFENEAFDQFDLLMRRLSEAIVQSFEEQLDEIHLPKLEDYWQTQSASGQKATSYLTKAFEMIKHDKVLLIDGLDRVLGKKETQLPLFELIRSWNENKMKVVKTNKPIVFPSMVLAYSTEPYPAYKLKGSVLQNVGKVVELTEFGFKEIESLARVYKININREQIERLIQLVGGLPALVNLALQDFKNNFQKEIDFASFETHSTQVNGILWEHLSQHLQMLQQHTDLLEDFKKILSGEDCNDEWSKFQLDKAGLIIIDGDEVKVRCELYQRYYSRKFSV